MKKRPDMERFLEKCGKPTKLGCIEWLGKTASGYGSFLLKGKPVKAPYAAFILFKGEVTPGKFVILKCRNKKCVNPEHLFEGSKPDYIRWQDIRQRFLSKCEAPDSITGCIYWKGSLNACSYGTFSIDRKCQLAHRVAYSLFVAPLGDSDQVLHRCDNPPCVNPDHLFIGDHISNMEDKLNKGRQATGEQIACSVLTETSVKKLRMLHSTGECSVSQLAKLFKIDPHTARKAIHRLTWKHV